ncbi:hypothetical protein AAG906_017027 [Vitis piasezkii]
MSAPVLLIAISAGIAVGWSLYMYTKWLIMKVEEPRIDPEDRGAEKAAALGRMIRELVASEARKKAAAAAEVEEETDDDEERMKVEMAIENMQKEKPVRFSSKQLAAYTRNYSTKLGSGGFGEVYKAEFPNGAQMAVKHWSTSTWGSLDRLLFGKRQRIEWDKLYEIAVGAAKGLEYLHHYCRQRIIHYDIKPGNVLLDSNFCPKLADFGLAKLYDIDITHVNLSRHAGTPGYAALKSGCHFRYLQEWFPKRVWEKFNKGELEGIMRDSGIEEKDMEKAKKTSMVALWCVQYIPEARPSMISVVKILEGVAEVATPPNPFQHLASSSATCTDKF